MLSNKKTDIQRPKIRFNSRDRNTDMRTRSSPRLKSFPAEKIKKLNNSPMFTPEPIGTVMMPQDLRETGNFFVGPGGNNGYGDAVATGTTTIQLPPVQLSQQLQPQNASTINQQQLINHQMQQIHQTNPQSESLLTRRIASPDRQAHRPFVPNVFQAAGVHDRSPRNPSTSINQPVIIPNSPTQAAMQPQMQQPSYNSHAIIDQSRNEAAALDTDCKKQSVDDRNTTNHRQMVMQMQQQNQTQAAIIRDPNEQLNNRFSNVCQCVYHPQMHTSYHQTPQQNYQPLHHHACHQQIAQHPHNQTHSMHKQQQQEAHNNPGIYHNCYNQQLPMAQVPGQGMTSPQNVTVNQMRPLPCCSVPIHQENLNHSVNTQNAWPQNDRWIQATRQNQAYLQQQPPLQWQTQDRQNTNYNQINPKCQEQCNPPQDQLKQKSINEQMFTEVYDAETGKKTLKFTPNMVRDQELLVSTMRQQGIPDDVMRRQFEALLNEQRRHLAYIAQFQQQEHSDMQQQDIKKTHQPARRTMEMDERPEWMVHITPPRMSYNDLERMRAERAIVKEQCKTDDQSRKEVSRIIRFGQQQDQQKEDKTNCPTNQAVQPQQMHFQTNPHQLWQQQVGNWAHRVNHQTPYNCMGYYSYPNQQNMPVANSSCHHAAPVLNSCDQQRNFYQNPSNIHPHPYHSYHEQYNSCPKEHNPDLSNPINNQGEQVKEQLPMDSTRFYRQNEKPVEPSSLLKIRMYKEIIRPQKCNNGLQDPETVQKALEVLKDPASRKGLEYLANMMKKKPMIKLNGIQEPNEVSENVHSRSPMETSLQAQKRISANGLENTRNPSNPLPQAQRPSMADEAMMAEYPRQRQNPRTCYSMQAERENGTMAISQQPDCTAAVSHPENSASVPYDQRNALTAHNNGTLFQYNAVAPQHYQQMQRCYHGKEQNFMCHNGGQGDVASMQRLDAPDATRIDRAGGDTSENSNTEEAMKCIDCARETKVYEQPEIHDARTIEGVTYLPRKSDYAPNNHSVPPNALIANNYLQQPMML